MTRRVRQYDPCHSPRECVELQLDPRDVDVRHLTSAEGRSFVQIVVPLDILMQLAHEQENWPSGGGE